MDTQTYRTLIKQIMTEYATLAAQQPMPGVETLPAFDEARDQYLWLQAGWAGHRRVQAITLHVALVYAPGSGLTGERGMHQDGRSVISTIGSPFANNATAWGNNCSKITRRWAFEVFPQVSHTTWGGTPCRISSSLKSRS